MTNKWRKIALELEINSQCEWYGWLERKKAISIMNTGDVFCITSIKDLTSTVTLEALSFGLPIVCLDHCGFAHVVTEKCGLKIPVNTPREAATNFRVALEKLYHDEPLRQELSKGAIKRAADFSWKKKIEELNAIYSSLLKQKP
jgi:glycosyltransferase involved in cell wall biosynthesis